MNYFMKNTFKIITCLLLLFAVAVSCSDEMKDGSAIGGKSQKIINPNGDSELALLMRAMFDEAQQIRQQIANNEPVTLNLDHKKILTAHATQPEKAASPEYKAFADLYLRTMESLQTADSSRLADLYDSMVENCMTCHQAMCPGPMMKIKKLRKPSGR